MASKNISLKEVAYERLVSLKRDDESFSDEILRITEKKTGEGLKEFIGLWSNISAKSEKEFEAGVKSAKMKASKILEKWGK